MGTGQQRTGTGGILMHFMVVEMPGGIVIAGRLVRTVTFKAPTGTMEIIVDKILHQSKGNPQSVTTLLCELVESIGGVIPTKEIIGMLSPGDRKFLMTCGCILFFGDTIWLHQLCGSCGEFFDIQVRLRNLPLKRGGTEFPFSTAVITAGTCRLRSPIVADLEAIEGMNQQQAELFLLKKTILLCNEETVSDDFVERLTADQRLTIESALEEDAPDVGTRAQTQCPECNTESLIDIDIWDVMCNLAASNIYKDVNTLAFNYHWSESEILGLERDTRHLYLRLIETSRGMAS